MTYRARLTYRDCKELATRAMRVVELQLNKPKTDQQAVEQAESAVRELLSKGPHEYVEICVFVPQSSIGQRARRDLDFSEISARLRQEFSLKAVLDRKRS